MVTLSYSTLVSYFQAYGVMDFLLPFLLVFTILFAVLQKVKLFEDHKNFRVIIALVIGLLFVGPHIAGTYPLGYDPVQILNQTLPSIALVAVACVMVLLLLGVFGANFTASMAPIIALLAMGFVLYIFGASLNFWQGPYDIFSWWTQEVTELLIIIFIFSLIVYFIVRDPTADKSNPLKAVGDLLSKVAERK